MLTGKKGEERVAKVAESSGIFERRGREKKEKFTETMGGAAAMKRGFH